MTNIWKRPDNVPYPQIWSRFEGKKEINGQIPKFWIQDIPEDLFDTATDIMFKSFIFDEPLCKYSNIIEDEESVQEIRKLWRELVQQKLGLICFMETTNPADKPVIAGLNMTYPSSKGEEYPKFKGKSWTKVLNTVLYLCQLKNPFEALEITEYMNAMGLSVLPNFRGQGIGEELLKARIPLCKAVGLKATVTVFTATASQKLAERVGFKDLITLSYDALKEKDAEYDFPGITDHTKSIKFMYMFI